MASIALEGVTVEFPIYSAIGRSMKGRLLRLGVGSRVSAARRGVAVRALDDVSAEFHDGDRVGLIGRNGAGKSTLLRVLSGIYEPPLGRIAIEGRIAALLDMRLGMDPEASGYDNIVMRGLFLRLSKREIEARLAEIEAFTELGEHLALPLRTYSTGMAFRLAFAVSTCVEPEILLIDEVIGAGDAHFMEKAQKRLNQLMDRARILVMASHAPGAVLDICNKAVLLQNGRVAMFGPVEEVIDAYQREG